MAEPIIKTEKLKVIYNQGKSNESRALDDVSVEIYPEEYVVFFGPSGCGKSTLLYSIAGLQAPTHGEAIIGGQNLSKMNKKERLRLHQTGVGMIFQAFYLITSLNIIGNVCLPKSFMGKRKKIREEEGMKLLDRFGIIEQAKKFPSQLSGGQKQRVAIARSLANNPEIILADEPVGNLDSESAENVLKILKNLNETDKKTIILVTHNAEHLHFADRILYMKDGKVVKEVVNKDKRPKEARKDDAIQEDKSISAELRILMRTFKDLTKDQVGVFLVPFKAKQLLSHILIELTSKQLVSAEDSLKQFLFRNIDIERLEKNLDLNFEKGGANWNSQRARSFTERVGSILSQVDDKGSEASENMSLANYLLELFELKLSETNRLKFRSLVKIRESNEIDGAELQKRLDAPEREGGVGLYKSTAEKVVREIEIIMLLRYGGDKPDN